MTEIIKAWVQDGLDFVPSDINVCNVFDNRYRVDCYVSEPKGIITQHLIRESLFLKVTGETIVDLTQRSNNSCVV